MATNNELPYNSIDLEELQNALSEVDMTLAYSSEKLANLENLLVHILAEGETDIGAIDVETYDNISTELIEKAFTFDLLYAILILELREVDDLMGDLQVLIVDALHKISSCEHSRELLNVQVHKLHNSEELLKQSQERVLEMKIQLAKLQMTSFSYKQNEWKYDIVMGIKDELHLTSQEWKPQTQTVEQRRVLRMLEKSLARELELEKKLTEFKQNEEDLKLKIRLTEQVAVCMEEAAEVAWGRFLEADNTAEVLTGISKEMLVKLQIVHFNLRNSTTREEELSSKLRDCVNQLNSKEASIRKLNMTIEHLMTDNAEVTGLRGKVEKLEEKLNLTENQLKDANDLNQTSHKQIKEMEGEIESLRENLYAAEGRAGNAEEKVTHLTESNVELTDELDFLKGSNESNAKKVSLLEKQLRNMDIQLQHSRSFSESSQEQQSMLYTAIWDMETMIDELKQKVATAESKTESMEERCSMLSETNAELNKELDFQRSKVEFMETCLNQVSLEKKASATDISVKASLIMDTVMQLAMERERIHKQLISLTKENKLLRDKLVKEQKQASIVQQEKSCYDKEILSSGLDSAGYGPERTSALKANEISSESLQARASLSIESKFVTQVEKSPGNAPPDDNAIGSSTSANHSTNLVMKPEASERSVEAGNYRRTYLYIVILVIFVSIWAAHLFQENMDVLKPVES
ncbi:hypothetical protein BUALT_Bualt05G0137400 [Buddleja alternifolia]|uniref:WIT1/2 N-terminal helical bundle domain-containing protein n=1 Tax=Buddleja alternifolia TaxID=168488 RepID=A0AAV6XIZ4_9LAMI|nr:hypothetical protein BUALT_Bualt05G0137400 [Buddleja alternifolia]